MKPKTKFIIESDGSGVFEVVPINDHYYVPAHLIQKRTSTFFDNEADASYANLLFRLENGLDLEKYRNSQNFDYYVKRLKIKNPEYLI